MKIIKFTHKILNQEIIRLLLLSMLVIYTYQPFLNGYDLGKADAWYYHHFLHDALEQVDHGIFPVYVGQGLFNFFGTTVSLAPYYLLLGEFIHLISFKQLDSLCVQHLIVLVSAFAGAFLTYFFLIKINPTCRWLALILAFFYISCPGVMSLIYSMDMYYSFTAVPFLPLLLYGLIRNHQKNDFISLLLIILSFSLLWLAHSPIASWCAIILILFFCFETLNNKHKIYQLFFIGGLSALLNLWYFTTVFSLHSQYAYGGDNFPDSPGFTAAVLQTLMNQLPEVLLPLAPSVKALYFLQLGYSLWVLLILSLIILFLKKTDSLIKTFIFIILFFLVMLFPPPIIGSFLWSKVPTILRIANSWPMQRLYIILASLVSFSSFLIIQKYFYKSYYWKFIFFTLCMGIVWNIHEINYFKNTFLFNTKTKIYLHEKNQIIFPYSRQPGFEYISFGNYDPLLKNKLLDRQKNSVKAFDAELILNSKCLNNSIKIPNFSSPIKFQAGKFINVNQFNLLPQQKYLLCLLGDFNILSLTLDVHDRFQFDTALLTFNSVEPQINKIVVVPIYANTANIKLTLLPNTDGMLKINSLGIIPYDNTNLPIKVESILPFKAMVNSPEAGYFLEIFKEYLPGYEAYVNNKKVQVLTSPNQFIMLPVAKGVNHILLRFVGTRLMQITFYISLTLWTLLILLFLFIIYQQKSSSIKQSDKYDLS